MLGNLCAKKLVKDNLNYRSTTCTNFKQFYSSENMNNSIIYSLHTHILTTVQVQTTQIQQKKAGDNEWYKIWAKWVIRKQTITNYQETPYKCTIATVVLRKSRIILNISKVKGFSGNPQNLSLASVGNPYGFYWTLSRSCTFWRNSWLNKKYMTGLQMWFKKYRNAHSIGTNCVPTAHSVA